MIAMMFFIGLSRLYLGVHFFIDVLVGWLVGALLLWILRKLEAPVIAWFGRHKVWVQIFTILSASVFLILAGAVAKLSLGSWTVPVAWIANATAATPDAESIIPLSLSGLITTSGAFFGMAAGAILLLPLGGFNVRGHTWQLIVRYVVGLIGVIIIWAGLDAVFPDGEYLLAYILRFLRYSLVGFWITYLAPKLFIRLALASPRTN